MGAVKSRLLSTRGRNSSAADEDFTTKIVLFTGTSHRQNLEFALPLANDPQCRFKALVCMPSLTGSDYLGDSRVLHLLNKTLFVLQMDVFSEDSIRGVVREILETDGIIDSLVITSNVLLTGPIETHTVDQARVVFETNTMSVIELVKCVLPVMKKQRDGHLVLVTNQAGIFGIPFHDIYCASKFAAEGFFESIAPEALAFNVHTSIIETSMVKGEEQTAQTLEVSIGSKMENADDDTIKFQDSLPGKLKRQGSIKKMNSSRVAATLRHILLDEKPHFRYQLNKSCREAAKEKWKDTDGDTYILDAAERYLYVETERILNHLGKDI
ncbi:Retinol dehydrogenase 8 [Exaiptasia diaphana]|nr:Retinol dehydrogenase 8 [Exaiptasia diaphana]